jgi:hypothetical protein
MSGSHYGADGRSSPCCSTSRRSRGGDRLPGPQRGPTPDSKCMACATSSSAKSSWDVKQTAHGDRQPRQTRPSVSPNCKGLWLVSLKQQVPSSEIAKAPPCLSLWAWQLSLLRHKETLKHRMAVTQTWWFTEDRRKKGSVSPLRFPSGEGQWRLLLWVLSYFITIKHCAVGQAKNKPQGPGMAANSCSPSYSRGRGRRIRVWGHPRPHYCET